MKLLKNFKNLLFMLASTALVCPPVWAVPSTNADGDYIFPQRRGNRQVNWQVSDRDPKGLNCRMPRQFQGVYLDSIDVPAPLQENNRHDITQWSVLTVFKTGQRLQAVTGNMANQIVLLDYRGKPWIPVDSINGNCFVRANNRFIMPIPEDPSTLETLED
ncbi:MULTISPECIES: hypothetical protein [Planktothricoides]|uniref:Uncharacterized protein n=2 Tax=Planktothricoides raciborskii TaxID=132608 RepID=A0AAU8JCI2_9CYAN|nr:MULTISPECIES: hypothetical protein [Planktothricoides]KOR35703.1 hypothetical protein AM228_16775 [Planktothricoides sp. SR001]MBD2545802.1 hypothetical protein [Planktothricoides raciborskii FACHB-1370]MBD2583977.1 hypothetical protein [Planktothricoides raciborskii FACHB-1261]